MGAGGQMMKRIPRIQFPKRHANSSASAASSASRDIHHRSMSGSDVPPPPSNTAIGGKASLQPKRTPVSQREIDAILLGGCF